MYTQGTRKRLRLLCPEDAWMPAQRLYIYRLGATNACALTGEKGDSRLPAPLAPDRWQFWMQTSRDQTENGLYGYAEEPAVTQIAAQGFCFFTGSSKLRRPRWCQSQLARQDTWASSNHPDQECPQPASEAPYSEQNQRVIEERIRS